MLSKVTAGVLGAAVLAGAWVVQEGAVHVSVDQRGGDGQHLHLLLPAAMVPVALRLLPDDKLRPAAAEAEPWLPAIRVASKELARWPDTELVETRQEGEHVRIFTRGATLVIDVQSPRQKVYLSFPLKMAGQVVHRLEELVPAS